MGTSRCVSSSHRWRIPDWQLGSGEPPFVNLYLERSIRPSPLEQTRSSPRAPVGRFHSDLPSKTREFAKHCPAEKLVELDKQPTPPLRGRVLCRGAREGCVCGSSVENGQSGKAGGWADISTTPRLAKPLPLSWPRLRGEFGPASMPPRAAPGRRRQDTASAAEPRCFLYGRSDLSPCAALH
jgi:hypothetical protein